MADKRYDVLIVGAGAAGLMAAYELSNAGKSVIVLEARDRIGGRIHTIQNIFSQPEEAGAEFVHGNLPITIDLLKRAKIGYDSMQGIFWQANENGRSSSEPFSEFGQALGHAMSAVKEDISLNEFLEENFADAHFDELKKSIRGFAEGYDAADPDRFSVLAFRDEWNADSGDAQYRIDGGYSALMDWLKKQVEKKGGKMVLKTIVKEIRWSKNLVEVNSSKGEKFSAEKIIITLPLGLLVASPDEEAAISFVPEIPEKINAAKKMGYGAVIKILLEFKESFWTPEKIKERLRLDLPPLSFILSEQRIPTWWTQYPRQSNLLTGWLAGPNAEKLKTLSDEMLLGDALQSLAAIFKINVDELKSNLVISKVANWNVDPFARGAYAYSAVSSSSTQEILKIPVDDTIYFAGEALNDGPSTGTVEAAFESGVAVSKKIVDQ